ncbi:hypothetical protein ACF0H5_016177 [Mactra antiquata]
MPENLIEKENEHVFEPGDFSSNARTDILDKYSRFHGKTEFSVWCNAPDIKYINSFRDLIYDINPHHITCVYKKMFETAAVMNLLNVAGDGSLDTGSTDRELQDSPSGVKGDGKLEASLNSFLHDVIDKSNSCVYSSFGNSQIQPERKKLNTLTDITRWEVCDTPHAVWNTGYQKVSSEEVRENIRRQSKTTCFRALSPSLKAFPTILRTSNKGNYYDQRTRNGSAGSTTPASPSERSVSSRGRASSRERALSRERANSRGSITPRDKVTDDSSQQSSSSGIVCSTPVKTGWRFGHYQQNTNYIDRYREEYTYQRLFENLTSGPSVTSSDPQVCPCGHPACPGALTSSNCINRWYPKSDQQNQGKCSVTQKAPCITSGVPIPKRTPVLKTRPPAPPKHRRPMPYVLQVPKIDDCPKKTTALGFPRDVVPNVGFFATSLTVNNYNPRKVLKTSSDKANRKRINESSSSIVLGHAIESFGEHTCGKSCSSVANVTSNYYRRLNQNIKGTE